MYGKQQLSGAELRESDHQQSPNVLGLGGLPRALIRQTNRMVMLLTTRPDQAVMLNLLHHLAALQGEKGVERPMSVTTLDLVQSD